MEMHPPCERISLVSIRFVLLSSRKTTPREPFFDHSNCENALSRRTWATAWHNSGVSGTSETFPSIRDFQLQAHVPVTHCPSPPVS
jgi:hypothetical protein